MMAKTYYSTSTNQFDESFQKLDELRESGKTCDVHLTASNKKILAHKLVLTSASEYFEEVFYGSSFKSGTVEMAISDLEYETISEIVNYIYTGRIEITSGNVYTIYSKASTYKMNLLKDMCLDLLQTILNIDNCVKIWVIAENCENDKLQTAAQDIMFENLEVASKSGEFLSLSNYELSEFFKCWPKNKLYDSIITAVLCWAVDKTNCEETVLDILRDIPHTGISEDCLENYLSKNKFFKKSIDLNNWLADIYKERSKSINGNTNLEQGASGLIQKFTSPLSDQSNSNTSNQKSKVQAESEHKLKEENVKSKLEQENTVPEEKEQSKSNNENIKSEWIAPEGFKTFLLGQPILFMKQDGNEFYKYNVRDRAFNMYNKLTDKHIKFPDSDCRSYKDWIYVSGKKCCKKFAFDDLNKPRYMSAFSHEHGAKLSTAILDDYMFIVGGESSLIKGTIIDLKTSQETKKFNLVNNRIKAGIAVSGGAIYICGGLNSNTVERYDPRESRSQNFGNIQFNERSDFYSTAILSDQIYCATGGECKRLDLRNKVCSKIESPVRNGLVGCLVSCFGKIYATTGTTIYEFNNGTDSWEDLDTFPELVDVYKAISYD